MRRLCSDMGSSMPATSTFHNMLWSMPASEPVSGLFCGRGSSIHLICLRRHNKIVAVQSANFMRPPGHAHLAPFGQNGGMMPLLLGDCPHFIGKVQRLYKISELKDTLQPLDAIA